MNLSANLPGFKNLEGFVFLTTFISTVNKQIIEILILKITKPLFEGGLV